MKSWKMFEKKLASYLGGEVRSRALRGEAVEDVQWGAFSVEAKTRKKVPQYIHDWLAQAKENCEGRVPVVVWHQDRTAMGEQIVLLSLNDLVWLAERWGINEDYVSK